MGEEKEHTAEQGEREARMAAQHGGDAPVLRRAVRRFIGALRQAEAGHGEEPAGGQRGKDRRSSVGAWRSSTKPRSSTAAA